MIRIGLRFSWLIYVFFPISLFSSIKYLEDTNNSLQYFINNLSRLEKNKEESKVRILFIGTSTNGFDRVTSQMRKILQKRFGDGGRGFMVIKKGWKYHRYQDIIWSYDGWISRNITSNKRKDGLYGLGGVITYNNKEDAWVKFETVKPDVKKSNVEDFIPGTKFSKFSIIYQTFENAGTFNVIVDDKKTFKIDTNNSAVTDKITNIKLSDNSHKVVIRLGEKEVRLYGVVFERSSGLVIDALMLVGSKTSTFHNYNTKHIQKQIKSRNPDLIIFKMGANDVKYNVEKDKLKKFVKDYVYGVKLIRKGKPQASCLILSIKDLGIKKGDKIVTRSGVLETVDAAKIVSKKTGCAYYNLFESMGGEGLMAKWRAYTPPLVSKDFGHLLNPGARSLGTTISNLINQIYDNSK